MNHGSAGSFVFREKRPARNEPGCGFRRLQIPADKNNKPLRRCRVFESAQVVPAGYEMEQDGLIGGCQIDDASPTFFKCSAETRSCLFSSRPGSFCRQVCKKSFRVISALLGLDAAGGRPQMNTGWPKRTCMGRAAGMHNQAPHQSSHWSFQNEKSSILDHVLRL